MPLIPAEQICEELATTIEEARLIEPALATRLAEMLDWIRRLTPGRLRSKKYVLVVLTELLLDSERWLLLKQADLELRQQLLGELTPAEQYWICEVFPAWFREKDPKSETWKSKLIRGEFTQEDASYSRGVCRSVQRGGSCLVRLVADLSMSTDIVACSRSGQGLCVQLTRQGDEYLERKYETWTSDLRDHWKLERGLLISFLARGNWAERVGTSILYWCDTLPSGDYRMEKLD